MSESTKAVFLSYASQDAEAAKRICEALRSGGVEVWFDAEGGLEHGDAWDAKIRRQIKECVLFIPVISANTQARQEGYFRIEWELAAQRAMGIASGVAFILPIVVDGTHEAEALVPDRFRLVQWTKAPGGVVAPEVQQRFLKLWSHRTGALAHEATRPGGPGSTLVSRPGFHAGRGLAAVVFTDVVGYSARMQQDETGTMAVVQIDFTRMRVLCAEHGGEVLKSTGDGLLLCFSSVVQAVACGLQIQREFGARPANTLQHRMGIHLGDVFRADGDVTGDGVNIAARLETKARPGTICLSQSVYDAVKGKVPMEVEPLGAQEFKNITEPITVYLVTPTTAAPAAALEKKTRTGWLAGAVLAVAAALAVIFWPKPEPQALPKTALTAPMIAEKSAPADKSIAVLPITNLSEDKESGYFADGVHEDILTNLAHIRELRVVSRTSVMEYRGTKENLRVIAQKLGVTYILEGSVRRAGNKVRVTGQLIRAANDEHVWAKNYDRDLTDIFAIQGELAQAIAAELKTALSPREQEAIARIPTKNLAAYDLYLQAKAAAAKINPNDVEKRGANWSFVASLLQTAVELDPTFVEAWCELEGVYTGMGSSIGGISPAYLVKAKAALDRALALAPDSPAVIRSAARYYLFGSHEGPRALALIEELVRLQPNSAEFRASLGMAQDFNGKNAEALVSKRTAALLEPGRFDYSRDLQQHCVFGRRWDEALAETQRFNALKPGSYGPESAVWLRFCATGSLKEMEDRLAGLSEGQRRESAGIAERWQLALVNGDDAELLRLDKAYPDSGFSWHRDTGEMLAATVLRNRGDLAGAQARLADLQAKTRARLKLQPENTAFLATAAMIEAILNHKEEALALIDRVKELSPGEIHWGAELSWTRTRVYALVGEKDRAISEIARLLRVPSWHNVHELKGDPAYFSLRNDPRFAALPNDPLNNAPLF
jgi:TolB-like protein/class 3 adenylate cyclase